MYSFLRCVFIRKCSPTDNSHQACQASTVHMITIPVLQTNHKEKTVSLIIIARSITFRFVTMWTRCWRIKCFYCTEPNTLLMQCISVRTVHTHACSLWTLVTCLKKTALNNASENYCVSILIERLIVCQHHAF